MLSSENRLKKRKEFAYLYNHGKALHTAHLTLVFLPTKSRKLKIGFSVAKKIGKAHTRNFIKRRLRALLRDFVPSMPDNYNVVFIAKSGIENITFQEMKTQIKYLLNKGEFLKWNLW